MRYVVTGAAGFIGSHLTESLLTEGHDVVGLDSFTDYYDPTLKEENARGRDVQRVDLAEEELDFAGFDAVFHLAGQPGARSFGDIFPLYVRRNVLATQRVFEAAVAADVKVVWASSSSVYGDAEQYPTSEEVAPRPNNPYGITKLACEQLHDTYARVFGLRAVALRYFTVYGPRQRPDMAFARIVAALAADEPFELYGDGSHVHLRRRHRRGDHACTRGIPRHLQRRWRGRGDDEGRFEPARVGGGACPAGDVRPDPDGRHAADEGRHRQDRA